MIDTLWAIWTYEPKPYVKKYGREQDQPKSTKVRVFGKVYHSIRAASRDTGISPKTIHTRIENGLKGYEKI